MIFQPASSDMQLGPWNPGIVSQVPDQLRHLCTIFRPENVFTGIDKARELRDLTGLNSSELVAFRPQRLALHELLIRVTADLSVPDGSKIEDLGINFRRITSQILATQVEPRMQAITSNYDALRARLADLIDCELAKVLPAPGASVPQVPRQPIAARLRALLRPHRKTVVLPESRQDSEIFLVPEWESKAAAAATGIEKAAYQALARVMSAILVRHGGVWGYRELIASLAVDVACNSFASEEIGRLVESCIADAVQAEGFVLLPRQPRPVVMNTKGPPASGKSTLRPLQKRLAGGIGVNWNEFALISPDIWRKQLLDYGSLGAAYKYGGAFTGEELHIIDQKLDRYMARKAERGDMSHLLIDRFRFDNLAPHSNEAGSNLLTRFGQVVYLFFMIAPPEMLVERAWKRGLEVGRYKAVDDTLAQAIEAYAGMPELFFTWVERTDKHVHFEFLDNSVPIGERPRTVAFGCNLTMNVVDVKCLLDVERFCRINIDATAADVLYADLGVLAPEKNAGFLTQCVHRFREVNFADRSTGRIYLRIVSGKVLWVDRVALEQAVTDADTHAGLRAATSALSGGALREVAAPTFLVEDNADAGRVPTLGRWGAAIPVTDRVSAHRD